jgi:hypothetical protein
MLLPPNMGEWGSVTYVHTSRRRHLADAVRQLVEADGYSLVHTKGPFPDAEESKGRIRAYLRVVVLGESGPWSAIKTSVSELMCGRREGEKRSRISELAMTLERDAFQVSVYDGDSMTVMEASKRGRVCVSGGEAASGSRRFHDERIREDHHFEPRLRILRVTEELAQGDFGWEDYAALLVPGTPPDLVATDQIFSMGRAPVLPGAKWMAFAKAKPVAVGPLRTRSMK